MIASKDHLVLASFKEFLNYRLLKDIQAYSWKNFDLYEYVPPRVAGKIAYGSPYVNWVYDSSLVAVPNSVGSFSRTGNSSLLKEDSDFVLLESTDKFLLEASSSTGAIFDFRNGRILVDPSESGQTVSGSSPVQDFGIFVTSKPDSLLLNEVQFERTPVLTARDTYSPPDNIYCPAIFIKIANTKNKPFALSGLDWTTWQIRVVGLFQNYFEAVGVGGVLRDMKERIFPVLAADQTPIKINGDLKSSVWSYSDYLQNPSEYCYIMDSSYDIIENDSFTKSNSKLFVGIGEIFINLARRSRIGT